MITELLFLVVETAVMVIIMSVVTVIIIIIIAMIFLVMSRRIVSVIVGAGDNVPVMCSRIICPGTIIMLMVVMTFILNRRIHWMV